MKLTTWQDTFKIIIIIVIIIIIIIIIIVIVSVRNVQLFFRLNFSTSELTAIDRHVRGHPTINDLPCRSEPWSVVDSWPPWSREVAECHRNWRGLTVECHT